MKEAKAVNFLKLKASFGVLGYTGNTGFFLYQTGWNNNGNYNFFRDQTNHKVSLARWGNPDLTWEYSQEFNIGIEGLFFNNRLKHRTQLFP